MFSSGCRPSCLVDYRAQLTFYLRYFSERKAATGAHSYERKAVLAIASRRRVCTHKIIKQSGSRCRTARFVMPRQYLPHDSRESDPSLVVPGAGRAWRV